MKNNDIVMFHIGRCGSTVLCNALNQNRLIQCEGEIFNQYMPTKEQGELIPSIHQIIKSIRNKKSKQIQLVEVKFLPDQHLALFNIELRKLIAVFESYGFGRFIILERENYLRRMVSHCVALKTNIFHISDIEVAKLNMVHMNINSIKVGVKERSLIEWMDIFTLNYQYLRESLADKLHLNLTYEIDINKNVLDSYCKVCNFLEVNHDPVTIRMNKTNPFSLDDIVKNYDEVCNTLKNTPYQWMIEKL